ncbi:uncharacterized protein LOC133298652 [Gastrolobium bilobum]|uniref:uncharacterized protein LOC133298652 n=1 Tax=Gastrolobium bilobum TaxID=150636 RepID=UPI002AB12A24|nr:uncharacterized protein LOC133298652 [Gastrolobium bilobum]
MSETNFDKAIFEEASEFAGGIWVMWNFSITKMDIISQSRQYIHMRIEIENFSSFLCTAIYANPHEEIRHEMREEVKDMSMSISEPWLMVGDFIDIRSSNEKIGSSIPNFVKCQRFQAFLDSCQVEDVECKGSKFTWQVPKWNHLDRCSRSLIEFVRINLMKDKWQAEIEVNHILSNFTLHLKKWNKEVFGNINNRKKKLSRRIEDIQILREQRDNPGLTELEEHLQNDLNITLDQEELSGSKNLGTNGL